MKVVHGHYAWFLLVVSTLLVLSGTRVVTAVKAVDHNTKGERTVVTTTPLAAVELLPTSSKGAFNLGHELGSPAEDSAVPSAADNPAPLPSGLGTDVTLSLPSSPSPVSVRRLERQVIESDEDDDIKDWDDDELGPLFNLNSRESQLAQLHGLGAAEIATLTSWRQQKSLPRLAHEQQRHASPSFRLHSNLAAKKRGSSTNEPVTASDGRGLWVALKRAPKNGGKKNPGGKKGKTPKVPVEEVTTPLSPAEVLSSSPSEAMAAEMALLHPAGPNRGLEADAAGHVLYMGRPQNMAVGSAAAASSAAVQEGVGRVGRNLASQFLLRSPRENRQYDVPQIGCPPAEDGMERFACPSPDRMGRYRCIDDHVLCDGFIDCPSAEDEDRQACMFYKTMKAHLDVVADALLRWVRGR